MNLRQLLAALGIACACASSVSAKGGAVAWVLNQKGARNIWIAEAPAYKGRRLTNYGSRRLEWKAVG